MTQGQPRETRIIRCPACKRYYRITAGPPAPGTRLRCSKCGEVFALASAISEASPPAPAPVPAPPPAPAPVPAPLPAPAPVPASSPATPARGRVLVATDGEDFQALIGEVLTARGFELHPVATGDEAWEAIGSWRPHVALLDVALPGVPAFELCDRVRASSGLHGMGLILIASVFQQTRYKRAPTSLYGADDYIEKHHIRDALPGKVARLLPNEAVPAVPVAPVAPVAHSHSVQEERDQEKLVREEISGSKSREPQGLERLRESLRRYARIIISDIALYNQELVEKGIREGTFTQLLKNEIEEGRRLYLTRVPRSAGGADLYHDAVRNFIAKRTAAHHGDTLRSPEGA